MAFSACQEHPLPYISICRCFCVLTFLAFSFSLRNFSVSACACKMEVPALPDEDGFPHLIQNPLLKQVLLCKGQLTPS